MQANSLTLLLVQPYTHPLSLPSRDMSPHTLWQDGALLQLLLVWYLVTVTIMVTNTWIIQLTWIICLASRLSWGKRNFLSRVWLLRSLAVNSSYWASLAQPSAPHTAPWRICLSFLLNKSWTFWKGWGELCPSFVALESGQIPGTQNESQVLWSYKKKWSKFRRGSSLKF